LIVLGTHNEGERTQVRMIARVPGFRKTCGIPSQYGMNNSFKCLAIKVDIGIHHSPPPPEMFSLKKFQ